MRADQAEAAFWATVLRNRNVSEATQDWGAVALAGGYALAAPGTHIDYAIGVGSTRPLAPDDLTVLEEFARDHGLPGARLETDADVTTRDGDLLRQRGYHVEHEMHVLESDLAVTPPDGIDVGITRDRSAWVNVFVEAWSDYPTEAQPGRTAQLLAATATALFIARVDGVAAGVGALSITADWGLLHAGATIAKYRRHGVHRALIAARVADAARRGATRTTMKVAPGGLAERSAERTAFRTMTTRTRWRRALT